VTPVCLLLVKRISSHLPRQGWRPQPAVLLQSPVRIQYLWTAGLGLGVLIEAWAVAPAKYRLSSAVVVIEIGGSARAARFLDRSDSGVHRDTFRICGAGLLSKVVLLLLYHVF